MKISTRRLLRRASRVLTWPILAHIALALGLGFAMGFADSHYARGMAPVYAALFGIFVLYPLMLVLWWRLHHPGGRR